MNYVCVVKRQCQCQCQVCQLSNVECQCRCQCQCQVSLLGHVDLQVDLSVFGVVLWHIMGRVDLQVSVLGSKLVT